jgi:hypothetical protein
MACSQDAREWAGGFGCLVEANGEDVLPVAKNHSKAGGSVTLRGGKFKNIICLMG